MNHWVNETGIVSVEDSNSEGGGYVLKQHIWNAARDTISEWTGQQMAECSLYGIRVYKEVSQSFKQSNGMDGKGGDCLLVCLTFS